MAGKPTGGRDENASSLSAKRDLRPPHTSLRASDEVPDSDAKAWTASGCNDNAEDAADDDWVRTSLAKVFLFFRGASSTSSGGSED